MSIKYKDKSNKLVLTYILIILSTCFKAHCKQNKKFIYKTVDTTSDSIYTKSKFTEPYRNQVHFSSHAGWINDINGVFHYQGTYHLMFQHYPYKNEWDNMHWGYATSSDLLHWQQHNPALVPGENAKGMAYSGTAFIDHNNTLGKQTGINATLVLAYTDTQLGQALAYSTDKGRTWQAHEANPILAPDPTSKKIESRRDPKVFWFEPDQKWIMVVFEEKKGMLFYSSKNLLNWTYHSTFKANGFWECPDMFEITITGTTQKKWVLMAPIGRYEYGEFDGEKFTAESNNLSVFKGVDLYGGQSFYDSRSDKRIQFVWLGMWNREPVKSIWHHAVSFPVELRLEHINKALHLTRSPIPEITSLYQDKTQISNITIDNSNNPLAHIRSNVFDMQIKLNLKGTKAQKFWIKIADKTLTYDLTNQTFNDIKVAAVGDELDIRLIVDQGAIEAFINKGVLSWAEEFAFPTDDSSIAISADKPIKINTVTVHPLRSVWQRQR
ncbi:hypothetical protein C2869_03425 [Saccharobesus litoralis]|uniref:Levanase n=1 Tax=Saccharobesus litoralis TaxID=2172099 RepID=A0A2S0VMY9_9ALTE|nr:glycoside hydrolase family 32 protein [Saccharobesus litoralis]AWB65542.1 hypothetical protein C2869_03425 [Saccharobesus litoralis]